jgi:hypothetical protein
MLRVCCWPIVLQNYFRNQNANIDSRHHSIGFNYRAFAAQHRVLQQSTRRRHLPFHRLTPPGKSLKALVDRPRPGRRADVDLGNALSERLNAVGIANTIVLPLHGDDFNDDLRRGAKAARRASSEPWMRSIVGEAAY